MNKFARVDLSKVLTCYQYIVLEDIHLYPEVTYRNRSERLKLSLSIVQECIINLYYMDLISRKAGGKYVTNLKS